MSAIRQGEEIRRAYSDWASPRGLRTDILPWRLWEKAKQLVWDPAELDYGRDREEWAALDGEQRFRIAQLARGFMVGEEGVTLDIVPLVLAMADEGRLEETMYLTTFAFEEAKHVDFFHRWFDAVGFDLEAFDRESRRRLEAAGVSVPPPDKPRNGLFEKELPRVMRRLLHDRSPEAVLDAGITYNQFVEGCLAIAGYRVWERVFRRFDVLPALRQGVALVQRDERRHIAYGTYLCRRILAAEPERIAFARARLLELRDRYFPTQPPTGNGDGQEQGYGGPEAAFLEETYRQVERRIELMQRATTLTPEEAERGTGVEEIEVDLERT